MKGLQRFGWYTKGAIVTGCVSVPTMSWYLYKSEFSKEIEPTKKFDLKTYYNECKSQIEFSKKTSSTCSERLLISGLAPVACVLGIPLEWLSTTKTFRVVVLGTFSVIVGSCVCLPIAAVWPVGLPLMAGYALETQLGVKLC